MRDAQPFAPPLAQISIKIRFFLRTRAGNGEQRAPPTMALCEELVRLEVMDAATDAELSNIDLLELCLATLDGFELRLSCVSKAWRAAATRSP